MEDGTMKSEDKKKKYGKYDDYEIEHLADKIMDVEALKKDTEKMKYVKMCLDKKLKAAKSAVSSIAELKEIAKNKAMEDDSEE